MTVLPPLNPSCWIVTEGLIGTENQCLGLAEAMGLSPAVKRIQLNEPWRSLSPYLRMEQIFTFQNPKDILPPYPDILITSGRKSIAVHRYLKKQSKQNIFSIHIQDPKISPNEFDLIFVPRHDDLAAKFFDYKHVHVTNFAINRLSSKIFEIAKDKWAKTLSHYPTLRMAVMIGGTSKIQHLSLERTKILGDTLHQLAKKMGFSLMITASRRTPDECRDYLRERLSHLPNILFWDGDGDNPYHGFLAHADYVLVTSDSTSMIADAASTGKPVFIFPLEGTSKRHQKMLETALESGVARWMPLKDTNWRPDYWVYAPVFESEKMAPIALQAYKEWHQIHKKDK
jgi:uncharacterized protein